MQHVTTDTGRLPRSTTIGAVLGLAAGLLSGLMAGASYDAGLLLAGWGVALGAVAGGISGIVHDALRPAVVDAYIIVPIDRVRGSEARDRALLDTYRGDAT